MSPVLNNLKICSIEAITILKTYFLQTLRICTCHRQVISGFNVSQHNKQIGLFQPSVFCPLYFRNSAILKFWFYSLFTVPLYGMFSFFSEWCFGLAILSQGIMYKFIKCFSLYLYNFNYVSKQNIYILMICVKTTRTNLILKYMNLGLISITEDCYVVHYLLIAYSLIINTL